MLKKRLIPVLILRDGQVVQSAAFKHTNIIHWNPVTAVDFFNRWSVDEMVLLDVSRTLARRQRFYDALSGLSKKCFVPLSVGGWVTNLDEVRQLLRLGADKIVINTQAVRNPSFISECAKACGRQCIVVSIDVRQVDDAYRVAIDRGRELTAMDASSWAKQAESLGAGEIFLTSIDKEGSRSGYELPLIQKVVSSVSIPVIAFGGAFTAEHFVQGIEQAGADAVAAANVFHFTEQSTKKVKEFMRTSGIAVR